MGNSTRDEYKRTKIFVDRRIQGALVRQTLLQWVLYGLAILGTLLLWEVAAGGLGGASQERVGTLWDRYARLLFVVSLLAPMMVLLVIKTSHRFVGPVLRVKRAMRQLAAGEKVQPLNFRDHDYWHDLAEDFNAMAGAMDMLDPSMETSRDAQDHAAVTDAETGDRPTAHAQVC